MQLALRTSCMQPTLHAHVMAEVLCCIITTIDRILLNYYIDKHYLVHVPVDGDSTCMPLYLWYLLNAAQVHIALPA